MKSRRRKLPLRERLRFALLAALTALLASVAAAACGGTRQAPQTPPGDEPAEAAPVDEPRDVPAETSGYVPADAEFMRDMLVHHAQALEMTALAPERSVSDDLRLLARRIEQTQEFEIGLMRDWLEKRGEPAPDSAEMFGPHGGHGDHAGMAGMAGMASPEQMAALAASEGAGFDRMFLELMIRHHEGALVMVEDLKDHEGAGLEAELFVLLSHIDADQRAEIARMRRFLDSLDSAGDQG